MLIALKPEDPRPIYQQIIDQVKEQIMNGLLQPGDELPSVRDLADTLEINMHTVHRAYQELKDQKIVIMRLGQKVRVAQANNDAKTPWGEEKIKEDIHRLIVDAYHCGFSKSELLALITEQLQTEMPLVQPLGTAEGTPSGKARDEDE